MNTSLRRTARIHWALAACVLALAGSRGVSTLSALEEATVKYKAIPMMGPNGQMTGVYCEGPCAGESSTVKCCTVRAEEEQSPDGTIAN